MNIGRVWSVAEVKRSEAVAGENRCSSFLLHPVVVRACKDAEKKRERALFLACTIPLFSLREQDTERERERRRERKAIGKSESPNTEMLGDRVNVQPAINRGSCTGGGEGGGRELQRTRGTALMFHCEAETPALLIDDNGRVSPACVSRNFSRCH